MSWRDVWELPGRLRAPLAEPRHMTQALLGSVRLLPEAHHVRDLGTRGPESFVAWKLTALWRMPAGHAADPDDPAANVTYGRASALAAHHFAEHLALSYGPVSQPKRNDISRVQRTTVEDRTRTDSV